ncbi:hypothetical protein [Blastopirellula marina]|uniref:Uncharacterized protein n=1 Tax=Blastopirellula marina TaxID=124 RepID=A0A2S8GT96_9BACT|nr:hypothetical protein [Blastopirellula marina]PQO47632.1 hypothetical protein C5Y93_02960 [Blastopirellula marina]
MPTELLADAQAWWAQLPAADRNELIELCDARKEIFLFETFSDESASLVEGGKYLPHDDAFGIDEWGEDYFQHLLDHPELVIIYEPELRTFHIGCSRHRDAWRCLAAGKIAAGFACPFGDAHCRTLQILGRRGELALRPLVRPG